MEKLRRKLHRLRQIGGHGVWLLMMAFIVLGAVRLGLWLLPFHRVLRGCETVSQLSILRRQACFAVADLIWAVNCSSRYMPGGVKCLARALTTKVLMQQQGYVPELKIGVRKSSQGHLEAHAWIDYNGHIVMGNVMDLPRYLPLPSLGGIQP